MKKVIIVGAGYTGRTIAMRLRESAAITLIEEKEQLLSRERFFPWLGKKITDKELVVYPEKFCAQNNLQYVHSRVDKLYPMKRELSLITKERLSYDTLIVASGSIPVRKEGLAGENKQGVVFLGQTDPRQMAESLRDAHYIVIQATTYLGLATAVLLKRMAPEKEMRIFIPDQRMREVVPAHFAQDVPDVCADEITECIGEGSVKAVRIQNNKVYAADVVFLDYGLRPQTKLFENMGFFRFENNAFVVDPMMQTGIEHICAAGDCVNTILSGDRTVFHSRARIDQQIDRLFSGFSQEAPHSTETAPARSYSEEDAMHYIKETVLNPTTP